MSSTVISVTWDHLRACGGGSHLSANYSNLFANYNDLLANCTDILANCYDLSANCTDLLANCYDLSANCSSDMSANSSDLSANCSSNLSANWSDMSANCRSNLSANCTDLLAMSVNCSDLSANCSDLSANFIVEYNSVDTEIIKQTEKLTVTSTEALLVGLTPYTNYTIKVALVKECESVTLSSYPINVKTSEDGM